MSLKKCFRVGLSCQWLLLSWQFATHSLINAQEPVSNPTFSEHIAGILYENCLTCHRPGGMGPFSLMEYEDVSRRSKQISEVVESGYMPPWLPDSAYGPALSGERRLSDEQIALISTWSTGGAPPGELERIPEPPVFEKSWSLGNPDLILELPVGFKLPAEGGDIYRNFVIPVSLTESRWVKAIEFKPSVPQAVHHAVLQVEGTDWARARELDDPLPGFDGMDLRNIAYPQGKTIGWTPGQAAYETYPGTLWEIPSGADLVLQTHLLPTGKPEIIRPQIGLYFSDEPPLKATITIALRELDLEIPAGEANHWVKETLTFPTDVRIVSLAPHAHYLAKEFNVFVSLPDGNREWLLKIPDWDFNWQTEYRFETPVTVPAFSTLTMQIRYDNTSTNVRNPSNPPQKVQLGPRSMDEMGETIFELLVDSDEQLKLIKQTALEYQSQLLGGKDEFFFSLGLNLENVSRTSEAIVAYGMALASNPRHAKSLNNLGALYQSLGDTKSGKAYFEQAVLADKKLVPALLNLAHSLLADGDNMEAIGLYQKVVRLVPEELDSWMKIAMIQVGQKRFKEAIDTLNSASIWHEEVAEVNRELGKLYATIGDPVNGEIYLKRSLLKDGRIRSDSLDRSESLYELAIVLRARGKMNESLMRVQEAVMIDPNRLEPRLLEASLLLEVREYERGKEALAKVWDLCVISGVSAQDVSAELPFPEGVVILSEILGAKGDFQSAKVLLEKARLFAVQSGKPKWIDSIRLTEEALGLDK